MTIWDKIVNFFHGMGKLVPLLVTGASIATALIPAPGPEAAIAIQIIHKVADAVALNVGQNAQVTP